MGRMDRMDRMDRKSRKNKKQVRKTRKAKRMAKQQGGLYGDAIIGMQQDPYSPTILMDYDTYTATKNTGDPRF